MSASPADIAASLFLLAIVFATGAWVVVSFRRSRYTPAQSCLYFVNVLLTRVLWRCRIEGRLPLEAGRGAVIVCNHTTSVDPFFIQLIAGRVVHWMVAREYVEHPLYGWFLRFVQVIPTRRGGVDTAAVRAAIRHARCGSLVGILPEGRINHSGRFLLPVRPGAVLIALRARVPIVPCYIEGAPYGREVYSPLLMPARVRVVVGGPIDFSEYLGHEREEGLPQRLIVRVMSEIARMAGRDDFHVEVAGRRWNHDRNTL